MSGLKSGMRIKADIHGPISSVHALRSPEKQNVDVADRGNPAVNFRRARLPVRAGSHQRVVRLAVCAKVVQNRRH